jgi:hypothetical protein
MNPHASTKCAGRLLMALAAITSISLMAACGSGSPITPTNQVGFTNGSLSGTYVFSSSGEDVNGNSLALAGTFVANGKGGNSSITAGTIDVIDRAFNANGNTPLVPAAQSITTGSYQVGTDGRGQASLTSAYGTFILDFVLTSSSGGLVTEFDANGSGSGTLNLQTAVTSLSQLAGPFAFSLAGTDSGGTPLATAGAFTLNSSGTTSTPGVEDFNDGGVFINAGESLSAAATLGSGTGPGSITLTTSSFALTFDVYPISNAQLQFIETDYAEFLSGDAFTQTDASIPDGPMVFTMAGGTGDSPIADGGLMTSDGTGNFPTGLEDINDGGTVPGQQGQFNGTLNADASGPVGGRVFVNLNGFAPATSWVVYPSMGGLLMLEMDQANITTGVGYAQTGTSFAAPGNYGLNLAGENGNGEVDDIAQFNATTAAAPSVNMAGVLDENDQGTAIPDQQLTNAFYAPDSPATGRGSIIATIPNTYIGGLTLEYYTINSSSALFIDLDPSSSGFPQVAAGTFEQQSTPGAGAAARPRVVVHPAVRPHAAKLPKQTPADRAK